MLYLQYWCFIKYLCIVLYWCQPYTHANIFIVFSHKYSTCISHFNLSSVKCHSMSTINNFSWFCYLYIVVVINLRLGVYWATVLKSLCSVPKETAVFQCLMYFSMLVFEATTLLYSFLRLYEQRITAAEPRVVVLVG